VVVVVVLATACSSSSSPRCFFLFPAVALLLSLYLLSLFISVSCAEWQPKAPLLLLWLFCKSSYYPLPRGILFLVWCLLLC
jgi:hypothetical protein